MQPEPAPAPNCARARPALLPQEPLWFTAYANATPSYIPSRRMFPEGGYEVDASMDYYGWPARLAENTEDVIIATVKTMLGSAPHHP